MMKYKKAIWGFIKWSIVAIYLMVVLAFVDKRNQLVTCSAINIHIVDSLQNSFITKVDVLRALEKQHSNLIGIPLKMINTLSIEESLRELQAVKSVTAYKTIDGKLNVNIEQRKPMIRVINQKGISYYIDFEGQILPLSSKYTSHVMVVNGNIKEPFDINPTVKVNNWANNEVNEDSPLICRLFEFAQFINQDDFWRAQISQIYVDHPNSIELIPRVGPHTILIGDLGGYEKKMAKLKLFYETALTEEGWNKYSQINLKYRNQIVCTKR